MQVIIAKGYQVFPQYGLAIMVPCILGDISRQMIGEMDLAYGCLINPETKAKLIMHQVLVNSLPTGYRDASCELKARVRQKFFDSFQGEEVVFNGNTAVISQAVKNGINMRAIAFIKGDNTFVINLMTNDQLNTRFNKLTNEIKFF